MLVLLENLYTTKVGRTRSGPPRILEKKDKEKTVEVTKISFIKQSREIKKFHRTFFEVKQSVKKAIVSQLYITKYRKVV